MSKYVDMLDFEHDEVFGIFNRRLELIAMAHLAHPTVLPAAGVYWAVLALAAFVLAIGSAANKVPLWVSVVVLCLLRARILWLVFRNWKKKESSENIKTVLVKLLPVKFTRPGKRKRW